MLSVLYVSTLLWLCLFPSLCITSDGTASYNNVYSGANYTVDCSRLRLGQYKCQEPDIEPSTQQPKGCTKSNTAKITCTLAEGLICKSTNSNIFEQDTECKYTNGKSFEVALLFSIFLGMFGIDRFYLGYPAIGITSLGLVYMPVWILRKLSFLGLLKLCTLGFMFLGQLIDIILIATQIVGPADGSNYIINYYGPSITVLRTNNETYRVPRDDW